MSERGHYVAKFHLLEFADDTAASALAARWVWLGDCKTGVVRRRSPKNFGWARDLYDGPGGLRDRSATLESFLAREVESPAAKALQRLASVPPGGRKSIPPELGRYLAWAAARSLPMRTLYESWIGELPALGEMQVVEPPPEWLEDCQDVERTHTMEHPEHGRRVEVPSRDVEALRRQGWRLRLGKDDFLECVHLHAWYFQVRHFPRLRWLVLHAPPGHSFIIGDRPVVWGFAGRSEEMPNMLRHPDVQLVAPLSRQLCLFAWNALSNHPEVITTFDVNRIVAMAAHEWIAGSNEESVTNALRLRVNH